MSIDFSTLQGLTIPEGVVTQIADASGNVLWAVKSGDKVILEVEKITANTYAGETTYENEEFILLDIYPKTNGTVSVTYGGLTKTITDTSGAEEPNAQQVFFGTFNGVSDSVATPTSGRLTIDGDYRGFGLGHYTQPNSKDNNPVCDCISSIKSFGVVETIPDSAFSGSTKLSNFEIPNSVTSIGSYAFERCYGIEQMTIPASVRSIDRNAFAYVTKTWEGDFLTLAEENPYYSFDGSCLIEKASKKVIFGFSDAVIPNGVEIIGEEAFESHGGMLSNLVIPEGVTTIDRRAFYMSDGITDISLPSSLTNIGEGACYTSVVRVVIHATTPPIIDRGTSGAYAFNDTNLESITVPKGCGATYKNAKHWDYYADIIVEAS